MTNLHGITYKGRACFPGQGTYWCLVRVGTSWAQVPGHTKGEAIRAAKRVRKAMRQHKGRGQAPSRAAYWRNLSFRHMNGATAELKLGAREGARQYHEWRIAAARFADIDARVLGFYLP